ncbi:MAG: type II toxin-antitoxin system VapC family toxin [Planctomycetia bacterium]|nr:type II toxin-antitoxin system VapC family toxin [Planctomycetia bacterium]
MKYLLDTNTAQAYLQGNKQIKIRSDDVNRQGSRVGISVTVLAELSAGIENSQTRDRNMVLLKQAMKSLYLWPFDEACAYQYGRITASLKRQGRLIGSVDVMIAASVIALSPYTLVTTDSDFQVIPGLQVENWFT